MENLSETPKTKRRRPLVAFILSLLIPGLGQIYNGQAKKGVIFLILLLLFPILFGYARWTASFYGLMGWLLIECMIRIYSMIDAIIQAKRQKEFIPKKYNTWYYHLLIAIGISILFLIYDLPQKAGVQNFKVWTSANQPAVMLEDKVIVDTWIYDKQEPTYGDLVAFYSHIDGEIYMYRIVGLPNDKLDLKEHVPIINGVKMPEVYKKKAASDGRTVGEFEQQLPNGYKYHVYKADVPTDSLVANMVDLVVPFDSYFLLGDNRDNAMDSRYVGFIKREQLIGKVLFCLWGNEEGRINIDLRNK